MASIVNDPNGRRRILFAAPDGSRKAVRLGKTDRKSAESVCRHVEALLGAKLGGQPVSRDTAAWLAMISPQLSDRLAAVGPIEPVRRLAVGEFLRDWLEGKRAAGLKTASLLAWGQTVTEMTTLLAGRPLASLEYKDGDFYRAAMQGRGLRPATVHKRLAHGRQMLEDAVRLGHLPANPWRHIRHRAGNPADRRAYVPVDDVARVLDHCPNVWWRLLVALSRFGGLRVPSEAFSLTWGDVDWERGRLSVPSPKTEHSGKTHRVIPLFPLLRPHLEAAFEQAAEGSVSIIPEEYQRRARGKRGWGGANLRTTLTKIIRRAGSEPWPRVWHSLRASCESDLATSFPLVRFSGGRSDVPAVTEVASALGR